MRRYALRDDQWDRTEELLPDKVSDVGVTVRNNRLFVEAVLYRYYAGIEWEDFPEQFGDFRVVHLCHMRWRCKGVWGSVFKRLSESADNEYAMIGSTIARSHQHSASAKGSSKSKECIGRSKGGLSTKIHTLCDALGNPLGFHLRRGRPAI